MLTIQNIEKIINCVGFNMWTLVADTHYTFFVDVGEKTAIEITLARHKPKYLHGKRHAVRHPKHDKYLLQCNHISWKHYWVTADDIRDIWELTRLIESFINEVQC